MNKEEDTKSPYYALTEIDWRAMEMKYEGHNYKEIAIELGTTHDMVKKWFKKTGKLAGYYPSYAKEESELRRKEAHDTFKAHVNNAVRVLVAVMNTSKLDVARVQAAKEILNRELGEPLKQIELLDSRRVNEYLEAAKILDEDIPTTIGQGESGSTTEITP